MAIFSKEKTIDNSPKALKQESQGVLSVFKKTVSDLDVISTRALKEKEAKDKAIEVLTQESKELEALSSDNKTIINKFNKLLNIQDES